MTAGWLGRFRKAHHGLAYFIAGVLVLMAVVGFAASQILPLAERHPQRIAGWLGDRAGREVRFDHVDTEWTRRGPLLQLDNLRIGSGPDAVRIGDAEVLVSQYAGLLPGRSFTELRVRGLDITLERDTAGRWRVRGLPGQEGRADPLESLENLGELQLVGARLHVLAPALGIDARIPQAHLRLRVDGDRLRAGLRAWMRDGGAPVEGVLDFDRGKGDGRAWVAAQRADLAEWSPLLRVAGVRATAGSGSVRAWTRLQARRLVRMDAHVNLRGLAFAGTPGGSGDAAPTAALDALVGRLLWTVGDGHWRLDVPMLAFGEGAQAQRIERLAVAGGGRHGLAADRIDIAPLLYVAALSDRLTPALRGWLHAARPRGSLRNVAWAGTRRGGMRANAELDALAFQPAGHAPGLRGVSGRVDGDAHGLRFRPDPSATTTLDWPREYATPHPLKLRGDILGWREGGGWRVGTTALRIDGDGYAADVRGGMWFQGDGTRPWIDLAADIDPAAVPVAHKFWMRGLMPQAAVRWLEAALQGGRVEDARAVVSGDLDDWPFRNKDGLFHASARIRGGVVKFQPDWPEARELDAEVDFVADGFMVRGRRASLAGVGIDGFDAGIERFGDAVLTVNAKGGGDASRLLALLRQSPLRKTHGETFDQLEAEGAARVDFAMERSLRSGAGPGTLQGTVAVEGARIVENRWDLAFTEVSGEARYGLDGFAAEDLAVVHQQRPGRLSLRAGAGFVRDDAHAFEADLEAALGADELLQRAPELDWLRGRATGTSPWTIAVSLPKSGGATAPSRLRLQSDLQGTRLDLPAPLDKAATSTLPTTIDVALPLDRGDVSIAFGQRMALRARSRDGRTGVRVALGSGRVEGQAPAEGLVASGRGERLDAVGWATLAAGGKGDGGSATAGGDAREDGLSLRDVDVSVSDLRMIGASFPDTRLRAVPAAGGTAVRLEGPALSGALMLPRGRGGTIAGRFERLHWRAAKAPAPGAGTASTAAKARPATGDDVDPSAIPSLNLAVDDFRFGDARLGTAGLRTRQTATGMRIEQLQTRAPKQSIDVGGDWSRQAGAAQTRLELQVQSGDFGALLAGFGFGRQIDGGEGNIALRARWPGSPADFSLAGLGGTMAVDLRDGQLVQVEPGAGRVLGLLSIAQLPRRLSFDFSDFFEKGFAFDSVGGDVRFDAGRAHSENLEIDGPAAEIHMRGSADLRAQTYDQTIDVYPKAGNLLAVAGALAGGPVGAAIGAAANAVLEKPIGQLAARSYRITGPWKSPKVETIARDAAGAPKRQARAPTAATRPPE